jgi:hypothetical protein
MCKCVADESLLWIMFSGVSMAVWDWCGLGIENHFESDCGGSVQVSREVVDLRS